MTPRPRGTRTFSWVGALACLASLVLYGLMGDTPLRTWVAVGVVFLGVLLLLVLTGHGPVRRSPK